MLTNILSSQQKQFQGKEIFYPFGISRSGFGDDTDVETSQLINFLSWTNLHWIWRHCPLPGRRGDLSCPTTSFVWLDAFLLEFIPFPLELAIIEPMSGYVVNNRTVYV